MMELSTVLWNAEYADSTLVCFRQTQATDRYGFARNTEAQFTFTGIVTPETGDELERTAAGAYTNARITIHTPFQLSAGDQTQDADIVLWQGRRYTVTAVKDYSAFGFVCATGEFLPLNGQRTRLKKLKAPYCGKQSGPSCFSPLKRKDAKLNEVYRKSWSRQDARTDPSLTCIAAHDVGADLDLADSCHSLVVNRMNDSATGGYLLPLDTPAPEQDIDLDRALQPMVVGLTGLLPEQVHPRWQSTVPRQWPVPTDWCAVGVMRIQPDANPVCVHEGAEEGTERWMRDETLDVLCSFYGSHGMQYASRLRDGLTIAQNHQALHEHRMALIDAGELIGAPDFVHQQWIRRYDLALTLRRRVVRAYPILNLKSAQIVLRADSGLNVTARIPER